MQPDEVYILEQNGDVQDLENKNLAMEAMNTVLINKFIDEANYIEMSPNRKNKKWHDFFSILVYRLGKFPSIALFSLMILGFLIFTLIDGELSSLNHFVIISWAVAFFLSLVHLINVLQENSYSPAVAFKNLVFKSVIGNKKARDKEERIVNIKIILNILSNNEYYKIKQEKSCQALNSNSQALKHLEVLVIEQYISEGKLFEAECRLQEMGRELFKYIQKHQLNETTQNNVPIKSQEEQINEKMKSIYFKTFGEK